MNNAGLPGLYVHVPYCRTKCPYCDFYSVTSPGTIPDWIKAVDSEAERFGGDFKPFGSVYLGGGTPSSLNRKDLTALITGLRRRLSISTDAEATIEANPDDVDSESLKAYRDLGFNRISLGVQSLNEEDLLFLARRHTARRALRAIESIRAAGFENLNIDLMYGFGHQTVSSWERTIGRALQYEPEHVSCYELTLEERTVFGKMAEKGRLRHVDEDTSADMFLLASELLRSRGYEHYEVSNYAKDEHLFCGHNLKYWRHVPYLGLGPSAHSFDGAGRRWNVRSVEEYIRKALSGDSPVAGEETLTEEQVHLERLFLGLRTREGVDLKLIERSGNSGSILTELESAGLARAENGRLKPTSSGLLVADRLPLLFD